MKPILLILLLAAANVARAAAAGEFVPLFNGRDLTGWVNVNCAPETWTVRDGLIHCTGHPIGALRTPRQYENFILELEWRHLTNGGNSGVFIWASPIAAPGVPFLRAVEVQVLDNGYDAKGKNEWFTTHGDVFPIHGNTMKPFGRHNGMRSFPSEERSNPSPQWNHYRVVCSNGVIRLHVNGKEVSGGEECNYRKGYLGLESEGAPVEFRNIRVMELPSSGATPELSAPLDLGWRSLFTGLDLQGWKTNSATAERWHASGERLILRHGTPGTENTLWTAQEFGDAEFVLDCRPAKTEKSNQESVPILTMRGTEIRLNGAEPGKSERFLVAFKGREVVVKIKDKETQRLGLPADAPTRGQLGLRDTGVAVEFMNLYAREIPSRE